MTSPTVLFLSHGGGPLPLLGDPGHAQMLETLQRLGAQIARPKAIIVISAHWEEPVISITAASAPPLIYDYYGFPDESYQIQYPCPGHPELAQRIHASLTNAGVETRLDGQRGFDHGLFVPLKLLYPQADIPCVQISLHQSLDAQTHLALGDALCDLEQDNLLVIGSGFSFHNLRAFFSPPTAQTQAMNLAFEAWLTDSLTGPYTNTERRQKLLAWDAAPHARFCHPREEHLLPLHVCLGVAGDRPAPQHYSCDILGKRASMFLWAA